MKSAETLQPSWQGTPGKQLAVIVRLSWLISIFGHAGEISLNSHLNVIKNCWNSHPNVCVCVCMSGWGSLTNAVGIRPHKQEWDVCVHHMGT